jgi:chemotaxis methyl-accepting protein methylase
LIGVTSFFRDLPVFDLLRDVALPSLCASQPTIRVASIGCSDGAELYSIAMLLAESGNLARASLVGSDIRADAVAKARRGCYAPDAIQAVPETMRRKYLVLDRSAGHWQMSGPIVQRTRWCIADMLKGHNVPGPWDLILCRNVAMYLQPRPADGLWSRLADSLRPGGFLVLGKAERPIGAQRLAAVGPCVYRREA